MAESKTDTLIGQTLIEHYEVLAVLDELGDSRILKVKDKRDGTDKVLKLIRNYREEELKNFYKDAERARNSIKHPSLAQLGDFGILNDDATLGSCAYLVFEYLEGRSLYNVLNKQGRIELAEALPIFIQIAELSKHLHAAGVANIQLTPRKVILSSITKQARLSDPGLSSSITKICLEPGDTNTSFPEAVLYLSPEQCANQQVDHRSDVYSLGCIMYECLVGLPPFLSKSAYEVSRMHINEEAKPLRMSRDDLNFPLELDLLVLKSLRKNPGQRQQNMNELMEDLQHVRSELAKVPELSKDAGAKQNSVLSDVFEDLSDLFGSNNTLKVKSAVLVILGVIVIFGSVTVGSMLNMQNLKTQYAGTAMEREWQMLDAQAQKDFEHGKTEAAEGRYLKALEIAEKFGSNDNRRLLTTLTKLQDVYYSQKKFDKADEIETRIKELMAANDSKPAETAN